MPAGFTVVKRVTPPMQQWAHEIEVSTRPGRYGEVFYKTFDGVVVAAIVELHTHTTNSKGKVIPCPGGGCHGVTLYNPIAGPPAPTPTTPQATASRYVGPMELILFFGSVLSVSFLIGSSLLRAKRKQEASDDS